MTLTLSTAMEAARVSRRKSPLFVVEFEGVPYTFGAGETGQATDLLRLGSGITLGETNPLTGVTYVLGDSIATNSVAVDTLKTPSGFGADVSPDEGRSSISSVSIPILVSDELLEVLSTYVMKGREVRVKAGFDGVDVSEWVTAFTGVVDNIKQWSDGLGYDIETADAQRFAKRQVFQLEQTELNGQHNDTVTTLTVDDASGYPVPSPGSYYYVKVDKEIISYDTVTATTLSGGARGALGTTAAAHSDNAKVTEVYILQGHPVTVGLQVLTSTGDGTNGSWDTLPARMGAGVPVAWVDTTTWSDVVSELTGVTYEFWITEPAECKEWLEKEVFKPNGLYPVVKGDGTMSLKLFEPPTPDETLVEIDDTNTVGLPSVDGNYQRHYNQIIWRYDWNPALREFLSTHIEDDTASQSRYGHGGTKVYSMVIESRGMRSYFEDGSGGGGAAIAQTRSDRLFTRYADPPMRVSLSGNFSTFHIEPGDLVSWESSYCLDHRSGQRGTGTYVMECVSKSPDFDRGVMRFDFLYTPFAGAKYAHYAPTTQVDYTSATTGQKEQYVFIDLNDQMSNGDEPYRYQ